LHRPFPEPCPVGANCLRIRSRIDSLGESLSEGSVHARRPYSIPSNSQSGNLCVESPFLMWESHGFLNRNGAKVSQYVSTRKCLTGKCPVVNED
jgi:hypothetical protein